MPRESLPLLAQYALDGGPLRSAGRCPHLGIYPEHVRCGVREHRRQLDQQSDKTGGERVRHRVVLYHHEGPAVRLRMCIEAFGSHGRGIELVAVIRRRGAVKTLPHLESELGVVGYDLVLVRTVEEEDVCQGNAGSLF